MSQNLQSISLISGPYRATKLWNAAVRAFHGEMPTSRHRRGLRVFDNCFTGLEATAWLHHHLTTNPNFGSSVTQEQATTLFKKFLKSGLLEDAISGATAVQLKEKGLYRFSSVSPLHALRTPGRHSTSDLRASTRRLHAAQQQQQAAHVISPPLQDAKAVVGDATSPVSVPRSRSLLHQRPYNDRHNPGRQSGRESYRRLSHEANLAHVREHHNQQHHQIHNMKQNHHNEGSSERLVEKEKNQRNLNAGCGDGTGKFIKAAGNRSMSLLDHNKENVVGSKGAVMTEQYGSKGGRVYGPHEGGEDVLRYFKRPALRAIENTSSGGLCNNVSTQAGDTAAILNTNFKDKLNSNVYIPLGEIVNYTSINSRDSCKGLAHNSGESNVQTELNPKQHNALNTMSEFNGEKNINNDIDRFKTESNWGDRKTRSRVKSFLIKSSGNSKYHYLIPKFGVDTTTASSNKRVLTTSATTPYANSKTISPKLLHAVTTTAPPGQPTTNTLYQSIDTLRRREQESISSDGFTIPEVPNPKSCSQFVKPTVAGKHRSNLLKKVTPPDLVPLKSNSGSSLASAVSSAGGGSQSNLLAAFVGNPAIELRLEQAYIEAWLQILDAGVCGTPLSLPSSLVHGPTLVHNQQRVTPRGVVHVSPGHPDDLPHWLLAAMRFLAHWPSSQSDGKVEGGSIPNYPGVEADVYRMVRDYFVHQTTPVIPSAVATALLEVLSAVEFLDLTFRDPRHRFGNSSNLSDKLNTKNSNLDPLAHLNSKQRRSFVDLQALEDDCCEESVFATLPRASKKNRKGHDSFTGLYEEGGLPATDSVEDLMLNMSIAGQQQQCQQDVVLQHSTTRNNTDVQNNPNKSGVYGTLVSPESQPRGLLHTDGAFTAGRSVGSCTPESCQSSPYLSQASLGSSNVFLDDASSANNQRRSNSRHSSIPVIMDGEEEGSFQSRESEASSRNNSMENSQGNLTRVSSTNISHIEHFNKSSTGAVYVTGDDVRRRKKKLRFFSRASKKKKVGEGIENCDRTTPDLRRYSVYECLPLVADVSGSSESADAYSRPESSVELREIGYQNDRDHDVYSHVKPMGSHSAQKKDFANNGLHLSVSNPSLHSDSNTIHAINKNEYLLKSHQKKLSQCVANLHPEPASVATNGTPNDARVWVSGAVSWSDVSAPAISSSTSTTRAHLLRSTDIDHVALPPNSCFETAFTSDSPKTRIIPQKSVDTLHLRQLKRRRKSGTTFAPRPKSIAVPQHCAARFTEMADHENFPSYEYPSSSRGSLSYLGSPVGQDNSTRKHYWNNSPSMFEISSPYRPLSVADLATEPMSLQNQSCGRTGDLEATTEEHLRHRAVPVLADTFNRSRSTGDLNLGDQAWPSEQRLVTADSSSGFFGVDTAHKGSSGALYSMSSRGLSLVHRVRDSIRRRKGGVKDTSNTSSSSVVASRKRHRSRKGSATTTGADSSNGDNTSGCQSINSSCVSSNASCLNGGRELKSSEGSGRVVNSNLTVECQRHVQYAKVINAERGREVHQQNIQTLHRLRTLSGGFTNPCLSPTTPGNQCNGTDPKRIGDADVCCTSHAPQEGSVISPIIGYASSGFCQREQSTPRVKPSLMSPFSPSSKGGDTMDTASVVSFSDHQSYPYTVDSRPSSSSCSSEAFTSARFAPSFQHRSSVTTTNYNTHLSTHYARNHCCNQPGSTTSAGHLANKKLSDGAKISDCLNHHGDNCSCDAGDDRRRVQHQHQTSTSRAVMSAVGSSRSPSLSSLYTTALACYDESDPQPFALAQLTADAGGAAYRPLAYHEASSSPLAQENSEMEYECMNKKMSESSCSCCNSFAKLKTSKDCSSNNSSSATSALRSKQSANDNNDHSSNCNDSCCCKSFSSANNTNEKQTATRTFSRLRNVTTTTTMGEGVTTSGGLNRSCVRSSWHDAVPRVHTEEGTTRLLSCVQLLLLLLQPVARRRLHLLLRLLHKMSNNTRLDLNSCSKQGVNETLGTCGCPDAAVRCHKQQERCYKSCDVSVEEAVRDNGSVATSILQHQCNCNHGNKASDVTGCCNASTKDTSDHHQRQEELIVLNSSTRDRVLSELGWCILRGCSYGSPSGGGAAASDEASCRRLLRLLVDQHQTLLRPSQELEEATAHRLEEALCFSSHQQARSKNNESYRSYTTTTTTATSTAGRPELRDVNTDDVRGNCVTRRYSESSQATLDSEAGYNNANNVNTQRNGSASERITHVRFDDHTSNILTHRARAQNVKSDSSQQTSLRRVNVGPNSLGSEDSNYRALSQVSGHNKAFRVPHQESISRFSLANPNPRHTEDDHPGSMPAAGIEAISYKRYSSTSHFPVRHDNSLPSRPKLPSPTPPPYFSTDRSTTCNISNRRTSGSTLPRRTTCSTLPPPQTTGSNGLRNSRRPLSVAFNQDTHDANFQGFNNETCYLSTYNAGGQECGRSHENAATSVSYANDCNRRATMSSMPPGTGQRIHGIQTSTGQGLSYCIQVAPSEWELQRGVEEQQRHLRILLLQIVQDASCSDRDKKTRLKQFAAVHPSVYQSEELNIPPHLRCSDGGAPAKKRGVLRGMIKLASLSSLSRNKHVTKL